MKVVIIGGVAGGATAAARLRRLDEKAEIIVFERSGYVSYANCGLPYYIGGVIADKRALTLQSPESFKTRFNVDVRVKHEVIKIDRDKKTVSVRKIDSGEFFEESYDKLILSPGARPIKPDLPGIDSDRIFTLRTVEDTFRIKDEVSRKAVKRVAVIGGGFIGVETAENLHDLGLDVTLIQRDPHILAPIDGDMASFLHAHIKSNGINLLLGKNVSGFASEKDGFFIIFENEKPVKADMVVMAVGVAPESELAKDCGLKLGARDSIAVNAHMQTSDPDIYAVGDAISFEDSFTGGPNAVALAGPANKQGRIAADNIAGIESAYKGSPATAVLKIFRMTAAFTGVNERVAKLRGIDYDKVIISPASHASYYPGGKVMTVKVLFEKQTEKILGAQIVGFDGVDKRLDVIATAMQLGAKITDLCDLDLAYAPPYSSAKDPVNMVGFVARNIVEGIIKQFYYDDIDALRKDGNAVLLDVRTPAEYACGYADGFNTHIPVDELRQRINELDKTKRIYVMCQSGLRSYIACRILMQEGFDCYNFAGGYRFYESIYRDRFDENCATDCGLKI